MSNGKGLKIIQQLLMNANIKEQHQQPKQPKKSGMPVDSQKLRYVRTPEHDSRFNGGATYLDTQTGRVRWVPDDVDPNCE